MDPGFFSVRRAENTAQGESDTTEIAYSGGVRQSGKIGKIGNGVEMVDRT